jgi:hypothetical protein
MNNKLCPMDCEEMKVVEANEAVCLCINNDADDFIIDLVFSKKHQAFLRHNKCTVKGDTE